MRPTLLFVLLPFLIAAAPSTRPASAPASPRVESIPIPRFAGSYAIWGATGIDPRGHLWFGVCARRVKVPSAHLYEYDSKSQQLADRGDVVSELKRAGVWRDGEGQQKIHSKIISLDDGNLYFASMDEQGEREDGSKLPTWGSHLWRLRLEDGKWEHLLAVPEGLVAVGGAGHLLYALGYFGHVLYQYDIRTSASRSVKAGSVDGHISRNFLVDSAAHAYVPRLTREGRQVKATLVEFDAELKEIAQTPLSHYLSGRPTQSHGITGLQDMPDGSIYFTADNGYLHRVTPAKDGGAKVTEIGWFHPKGASYAGSLFSDGARLMGAAKREGKTWEWVMYDPRTSESVAIPLDAPGINVPLKDSLLYGSMSRDADGASYVVGTYLDRNMPILLRVK